jgi:hypothetical protein
VAQLGTDLRAGFAVKRRLYAGMNGAPPSAGSCGARHDDSFEVSLGDADRSAAVRPDCVLDTAAGLERCTRRRRRRWLCTGARRRVCRRSRCAPSVGRDEHSPAGASAEHDCP